MKINEIISEAKDYSGSKSMQPDHVSAIPGAEVWPELDNSSGYLAYRFGVQLAGMPGNPMSDIEGPTGLKMVTIAYSDGDRAILDATAKHLKTKGYQLSPSASEEANTVDKFSPIKPQGPISLRKK